MVDEHAVDRLELLGRADLAALGRVDHAVEHHRPDRRRVGLGPQQADEGAVGEADEADLRLAEVAAQRPRGRGRPRPCRGGRGATPRWRRTRRPTALAAASSAACSSGVSGARSVARKAGTAVPQVIGVLSPMPRGSKPTMSNRSATSGLTMKPALHPTDAGAAGASGVHHERADALARVARRPAGHGELEGPGPGPRSRRARVMRAQSKRPARRPLDRLGRGELDRGRRRWCGRRRRAGGGAAAGVRQVADAVRVVAAAGATQRGMPPRGGRRRRGGPRLEDRYS